MNWALVHGIAEEVELWTTIAINVTIILGGIPIMVGIWRRIPWNDVRRVAIVFGGVGLAGSVTAAVLWFLLAPDPFLTHDCLGMRAWQKEAQQELRRHHANDDDAARIIIMGPESSEAGCMSAGGN